MCIRDRAQNINEKKIGTDINKIDIIELIKNRFEILDYKVNINYFRYQKLKEEIDIITEAAKYADLTLEYLKENGKELINSETNERE